MACCGLVLKVIWKSLGELTHSKITFPQIMLIFLILILFAPDFKINFRIPECRQTT